MKVDLSKYNLKDKVIAVALSGGSDSMALLHYLCENAKKFNFTVKAINIEHGIRGEESISDTNFVKEYCQAHNISLLCYSVKALENAKKNKLTVEQSARVLRYECFNKALENNFCDIIASAHHLSDNTESILFNIFRGTGLKGLSGIKNNLNGKIIRPFIDIPKQEITEYINKNNIPFVTDSTNFDDNYTRNNLRINIIPKIKEIFPKLDESLYRLAEISTEEDELLTELAKKKIKKAQKGYLISLPCEKVLIKRATIIILNNLGVKKDWEKVHLDSVVNLSEKEVSKSINLLKGVKAIKQYDNILFIKEQQSAVQKEIPFAVKPFTFNGESYNITQLKSVPLDLKSGLFADLNKIPKTAVIRHRKQGDIFTKFGGKTKKLNDYFTDIKIPLAERKDIPILADKNIVLAIFKIAISDTIRVDKSTETIIQLS